MKKYIKLFLAMTLVIISMFSSARLNTTSALGATGAINITGQSITPTKSPVDQYTDINVNMNFSVPSTAKTGGQAIISLPKNLKFVSDTNFNVMSSDNKIVAKAVLNAASKTITLTYTDYVTKKSDIKGSLFFNVRVSPDTASPSKVPINISVNNKNIPVGEVNFVVDPGKSDKVLDKVSWNTQKLADGGITRDYEVRVNAENKPLTNAIVLDKLNTDGMSYVKDSFVIKKGTWAVSSNHKLGLTNATQVSVPVNFDASQKSFQINLGNVAANEGYSIYYKVKIAKTPKNGEQFLNNVTLKADKVTETKNNPFVYQNAGGEAEGFNYSVKIKKVDGETNAALAGANFDVIRASNNETVKSVTTDANGEALIDGLLNTEYKLVETKAPEGYQLNKEAIAVKPTDFNTSKVALKTISNKKIPKEPTPTNATIEFDKQLSGRDLVDGEFSFELYEGSNKLQTTTNKNGKISFDSISYKEVGEHTYTVKEVKGDNSTIAYDSSTKQVTVKVTKDGDNLKAEVVYPESKTFSNTFTPKETSATIELDKQLTGRDLVDGEFSFELYEGSNKLQTTTNKNGKVTFDSISYKEVGEHTYTIKEVKGDNSTVAYDSTAKEVTVKVTRDGDKLKTEVVYPESKTFNNTFTPNAANATIELDKALSGRDLVNGEFKFVLKDDQGNQVGSEATNQNGKITFPSIKFEKEGTYNYSVKEVKGENNTINYDKSEKHVTINVTKDGNNLKAEVVYPDGKTFNNTFTPNATNASIELDKKLDGRDLVDGEFSFDLYEGSNKLQTVTNKNGKVAFDSISYKEVGEHTYTIKEVKGDNSTITYDEPEKQVTVKVTRDGDNLKTEVVYPESKTFNNKFTPNEAKATIELEKQLTGRNLADGEFSFDLYEGSNKLQTTTNKNGKVTFDSISYKEVGEHTYTVKEVKGTDSTIAYDESEKHVTVKVTRDGDNLKTEVVYPESKVFHNLFTPNATSAEFSLKKNLSGRDLKDGEFTFTLFDSEGKAVKTVSNDANGNILFNGLIFSKEGRYTYKVVENKNNVEGITYDEVARTVTIDVKLDKERGVLTSVVELPENKVFNNSYKPTTPPKGILPRTGIGALSSSIAGLGILSLVGLAIRRKQKMN